MAWAIGFGKPWIALSITLGMMLGTAVLWSFDWIVRREFVPDAKSPGRALLKFSLLKYPLFCAGLFWLVRWERANLPAFCAGIVLVHLAIIAKMMGIRLVERLGESKS